MNICILDLDDIVRRERVETENRRSENALEIHTTGESTIGRESAEALGARAVSKSTMAARRRSVA